MKRSVPILFLLMWTGLFSPAGLAGALESYAEAPDAHYSWTHTQRIRESWGSVDRLELVSQRWHGHTWIHHMLVVQPSRVRNSDVAFLLIAGDGNGEKQLDLLKLLAERSGAVAAVVTRVPNQPLFGRREDHLVAYTFDRYLKSGDETWPLLFPMVKSAVRAMDTVQAFVRRQSGRSIGRFVVGGASKRGWTTWLTAAVDRRVDGIAPMVIDMLNMKAQLQWAALIYGKQSAEISEYTDLNLHLKLDDPPMQRLRSWVDPFAYVDRYTMPKLLLLGTNDPYWTVDSLRHYWDDLPGPKWIFQTPNAGHDLGGGRQAHQTLAAFFESIAERQPLPQISWQWEEKATDEARLQVLVDQKAKTIRFWSATSIDRDFRDSAWTSREVHVEGGSSRGAITVKAPYNGYRASLLEVELMSPSGWPYKLSTEARVLPEILP